MLTQGGEVVMPDTWPEIFGLLETTSEINIEGRQMPEYMWPEFCEAVRSRARSAINVLISNLKLRTTEGSVRELRPDEIADLLDAIGDNHAAPIADVCVYFKDHLSKPLFIAMIRCAARCPKLRRLAILTDTISSDVCEENIRQYFPENISVCFLNNIAEPVIPLSPDLSTALVPRSGLVARPVPAPDSIPDDGASLVSSQADEMSIPGVILPSSELETDPDMSGLTTVDGMRPVWRPDCRPVVVFAGFDGDDKSTLAAELPLAVSAC